nr:ankyrin repeat domain-containing protein [uncultured Oscillibacter sp.]
MNVIEFDRWKPSADDPRKLEYDGQRPAAEVFEELRHRLESQGYLPDEYFLLDDFWKDGREIPKDAGIFCTTDYGGSEGVYLDAYLKWYDKGQEKSVTQKFFTGKTLGENGNDLDRMFLISSAITKAFHGDSATHARYMKIGGVEDDTGGRVVHLSQQEEKVIIKALVEQRERQEQAIDQTEQLLRRMTGSITAYMDTVGHRPLRLDDYDRAVLAIRDGELNVFQTLLPNLKDRAHDLLIEAAGRPGIVGRKMTVSLLSDVDAFPESAYRDACLKAIGIEDFEKVSFLLEEAESYVPGLSASFHGEMASKAYLEHRFIAKEIVKQCTDEQIAAAPPYLLEQFAADKDWRALLKLVEKGISGGSSAWRTLHMLTCEGRDSWIAKDMLEKRMWVDTKDYDALHACVKNDAVEVCKLLLDGGMDFDQHRQWAETRPCAGHEETLQALTDHWVELQAAQAQGEQAPEQTGGMTLG